MSRLKSSPKMKGITKSTASKNLCSTSKTIVRAFVGCANRCDQDAIVSYNMLCQPPLCWPQTKIDFRTTQQLCCRRFCRTANSTMGRVARYKKVKSFDPYSKQNGGRINLEQVGVWGLGSDGRKSKKRSKTSEKLRALKRKKKHREAAEKVGGFDLPPEDGDDFDLNDLVGSVRKEKLQAGDDEDQSKAKSAQKAAQEAIREEKRIARLLRLDEKRAEEKKKEFEKKLERKKGETMKDFRARARLETTLQFKKNHHELVTNPERHEKKREFMKNKRKRRKGSNKFLDETSNDEPDTQSDDDGFVSGEAAVAAVALAHKSDTPVFGEQVERPPTFRQLPRGAKAKEEPPHNILKMAMKEEDVAAEQDAMEKMRRKVQAQYAMVRKKRQGGFHL